MGTDIDLLVVGNCKLEKEKQDTNLVKDYKNAYDLD